MSFMWEEILEQPAVLRSCIRKNEDALNRLFVCAAAAQMLACDIAKARGLGPDGPRLLHKVIPAL